MIRTFMKTVFPRILDILFITSEIGVIVSAVLAGNISRYSYGSFFLPFISTLIIGTVGVIAAFGVLYLLLDIRDALNTNNNGLKEE